ncbi:MAG: type 1 glutamine amidotransferase [Hoeflea sp.]|nr:type 1 glutamine amidotransferase [Hoeflea sp.]
MRIAILDCSRLASPLLDRYGSTAAVIAAWLAPHMQGDDLVGVAIGDGAPLPRAGDFDGFVVSGSEMGVYDAPDWMAPMRALLLDIRDTGKPVYGMCFGHQLMADTYGGKAEKSAQWSAGARRFTADGEVFDAFVLHGDQVTEVPPGSRILASADYCPIAALTYDFPAMSTQFHPEYETDFVEAVIDLIQDQHLGARGGLEARQSMDGATVKLGLFADKVAAFFKEHGPAV